MSPDDAFGIAQAAARTLIYLSTLLAIGVCTAITCAGPVVHPTLWRWARRATGTVFAAYVLRFYVQTVETYYSPVPTWYTTYMLLFLTLGWGKGILAQFVVTFTAWRVTAAAHRRANARVVIAGVAAALGLAVPLAGHAIAHGGVLATLVQGIHVTAAGVWAGGLATTYCLGALVSSGETRPAQSWRGSAGQRDGLCPSWPSVGLAQSGPTSMTHGRC